MIYRVFSSIKTFRPVIFNTGFNIVLAETVLTDKNKKSRNALGKSTLLEVIHFCLGSDEKRTKIPYPLIPNDSFSIELNVGESLILATRAVKTPSKIFIEVKEGDIKDWPHALKNDEETALKYLSLEEWRLVLGKYFFGLDGIKISSPSFRQIISYFIRRGDGAYDNPLQSFSKQSKSESLNVHTLLLGLNNSNVIALKEIETEKDFLEASKKRMELDHAKDFRKTLEAKRVILEDSLNHKREELKSFQVHEEYHLKQKEADSLTAEIHKLTNRKILDNRNLQNYVQAVEDEQNPEMQHLEALYKEVGIIFSEQIIKSIEETRLFHANLIKNRKDFLSSETIALTNRIATAEERIKELINSRASLMQFLETHGAIEEYQQLNEEFLKERNELEQIKIEINSFDNIKKNLNLLKSKRVELESKMDLDIKEKQPNLDIAIKNFAQNIKALYEEEGYLSISSDKRGYQIDFSFEKKGSDGVNQMIVLSYDFTIATMKEDEKLIDFLIHDSRIYADVDKRQIAAALELAAKQKFQYICTFNSDNLPMDVFSKEFDIKKYICHTLDDSGPEGTLFGFRFRREDPSDEDSATE